MRSEPHASPAAAGVGISSGRPRVRPIVLREPVSPFLPDILTRQSSVRVPEGLLDPAEGAARVSGTSVHARRVESVTTALTFVRADHDFTERARELVERDQELLGRLAR